MPSSDISTRLSFAIEIAREAAGQTLSLFRRGDPEVITKADGTPVTAADRDAERRLRAAIAQRFPSDAILGEEFGETPGISGYRWILDPIDGTQAFIRGVPLYGTLVGVEMLSSPSTPFPSGLGKVRMGSHAPETILGVLVLPALDEYLYAANGQGAWWSQRNSKPKPARVTSTAKLSDALVCITSVDGFPEVGRQPALERLTRVAKRIRGWGDCYGAALVATGRADAMVDPAMNPWDCTALKPIVEQAGGTYTDWLGHATAYGGDALATNGRIHAELRAALTAES